MIEQLKYGTSTSQTFWGCDESDTGGVLGVYVDGILYTGETLSADNDYTGIVEVTGLSSGSHTWQIALDGVAQNNQLTFQTVPSEGENFNFVVVGDSTGDCQGFSTILSENARYGIVNGDWGYMDVIPNYGSNCSCGNIPTAAEAVVYATVLTQYRCIHRCHLTFGSLRSKAFRSFQWNHSWHNHEYETPPFQDMTDPDASGQKYLAAKKAADEYMFAGNAPVTGSWDTYPNPRVYRDWQVGDCHFLQFDHTSYGWESGTSRSLFEGTVNDGSGGSNTGNQQLDWAVSVINSSTSKFIFLITPAEPVHSSVSASVGAQWQTLFDAVNSSSKTIILVCGDTHQLLAELLGGTKLPDNPLLVVSGTPLLHPSRSTASTAWDSAGDATIYTNDLTEPPAGGIGDIDSDFNYNYTVVQVRPNGDSENSNSHVKIQLKNAITGQTRWSCMVDEGARTPTLPKEIAQGLLR